MTGRYATLLAIALLALPAFAPAHHSISVIDIAAPVWVKGRVVRYRPGSPHALLELEAQRSDGKAERWFMEGPFPGRMARIIALYGGDADTYLKPGDAIEACGFPPRAQYPVQRSYADQKIDPAHFIHVQLMVMPGEQMRSWGPYGKLDNCIRATDRPAAWREFLDRDPLAHDLWCTGLAHKAPSVAPPAFVNEVNRGLALPCP